jgi:hypothetical protein
MLAIGLGYSRYSVTDNAQTHPPRMRFPSMFRREENYILSSTMRHLALNLMLTFLLKERARTKDSIFFSFLIGAKKDSIFTATIMR